VLAGARSPTSAAAAVAAVAAVAAAFVRDGAREREQRRGEIARGVSRRVDVKFPV
jgi:hypothetical protein